MIRNINVRQLIVPRNSSLERSISEFGIEVPLTVTKVDERDYKILDGVARWRAAMSLGLEQVPCNVINEELEVDYKNVSTAAYIRFQEWLGAKQLTESMKQLCWSAFIAGDRHDRKDSSLGVHNK